MDLFECGDLLELSVTQVFTKFVKLANLLLIYSFCILYFWWIQHSKSVLNPERSELVLCVLRFIFFGHERRTFILTPGWPTQEMLWATYSCNYQRFCSFEIVPGPWFFAQLTRRSCYPVIKVLQVLSHGRHFE